MRELIEWMQATRLPDRPWLLLGKGPTFSRRDEFDLSTYNLLSLNHAVVEQRVDVAHVVDIDVIEDCGPALVDNCRWLVMPRHPHVQFQASVAKLEDFVGQSRWLQQLDDEGRLIWYNAATGIAEPGSPVMDLRYFSSEAALSIVATMGASTVRSLGIDGGASYSPSFVGLEDKTLLRNGRPSFNAQFRELERIASERHVDFQPLIPPLRVFVGADVTQAIPAAVLEHSIVEHSSQPVRVDILDQPLARLPRDKANRPRTAFSFNRFRIPALMHQRGVALYLDSDMLVLGDVAELFEIPFGSKSVLCTSQGEPPEQWRDHPDFKAGRQFSVMLIDCARVQWDVDEVIAGLDLRRFTYAELMFDLALVAPDQIGESIPPEWNHLERYEPGRTRNVHFTVVPTQPWRVEGNPLASLWLDAYRRAVEAGAVDLVEVERAVAAGWVRASLLDVVSAPTEPASPTRRLLPVEIELRALRDALARRGMMSQLQSADAPPTPDLLGAARRTLGRLRRASRSRFARR